MGAYRETARHHHAFPFRDLGSYSWPVACPDRGFGCLLGGFDEELDHAAGITLSAPLNDMTRELVAGRLDLAASGDVRFRTTVNGQGNEDVLWAKLQIELLRKGIEQNRMS